MLCLTLWRECSIAIVLHKSVDKGRCEAGIAGSPDVAPIGVS